MRNIIILISLQFLPVFTLLAQKNDDILMTIGNQKITSGEFEHIYHKNNNENIAEKQSINEYLDLFINFKLKVIEAENLGMDTTAQFKNELSNFVNQLEKSYLTDSAVFNRALHDEYDRMHKEVHACHIMLRIFPQSSPEDTLKAYNKIMNIHERLLKGEDFEAIARAESEDPSVKSNGGDLGWFTAFHKPYAFEIKAYNTPVGEISEPFRTEYGYHIIKVLGIRPARPAIQVAHIFVGESQDMNADDMAMAKDKIYRIYIALKDGSDFSAMAKKFSEDPATANSGGVLPWFNSGQMIPVFENAAYSLKNPQDFTEPVHTSYGWHIIKLLDVKELGSFEEEKPNILLQIKKGGISSVEEEAFINNLKREYNFKVYQKALNKAYKLMDSSIFDGNWDPSVMKKKHDAIFTIGKRNYPLSEFADFLNEKQRKTRVYSIQTYVNNHLNEFSKEKIIEYEKQQLPKKYPEFKYAVREYHDGILLFDLNDKMIWSKAVKDTAGLENYYEDHKTNYMWEDRVKAIMISSTDSLTALKAFEIAANDANRKKFNKSFLISNICPDGTRKDCINYTESLYERGENELVDATGWKPGPGKIFKRGNNFGFVYIRDLVPPQIKTIDETRGMVTSDYQKYLEKQWVDKLRKKYPVQVNKDLLKNVK